MPREPIRRLKIVLSVLLAGTLLLCIEYWELRSDATGDSHADGACISNDAHKEVGASGDEWFAGGGVGELGTDMAVSPLGHLSALAAC
jgi:hypothetical protein